MRDSGLGYRLIPAHHPYYSPSAVRKVYAKLSPRGATKQDCISALRTQPADLPYETYYLVHDDEDLFSADVEWLLKRSLVHVS